MSFFQNIFSKAKDIVNNGKNVLSDINPGTTYSYKKPEPLPKPSYNISQSTPSLTALRNSVPPKEQITFGVKQNATAPLPSVNTANSTAKAVDRQVGGKLVIPSVIKSVVQGTARGALAAEFGALDRIRGISPEVSNKLEYVPKNWISKKVFGEEPISVKSEVIDPLTQGITIKGKRYAASEEAANKYGFPLLVASTIADALTGGGKKKLAQDALMAANDFKTANKVLKNFGLSDEAIKIYKLDSLVVGIKTPEQATQFTDEITSAIEKSKQMISKNGVKNRMTGPELDVAEKYSDFRAGVNLTENFDEKQLIAQADTLAAKYGVKKDELVDVISSAPDKPVTVNRPGSQDIVRPTQRERSFSRRVDEKVPEADFEKQIYDVRSTPELAQRAKNIVDTDSAKTRDILDDIKNGTNVTDEHIAVASQQINKYTEELKTITDVVKKEEIYDKIADISHDTAAELTKLGQSIQAATILGKVTPEGTLRRAARGVNKWNRENPTKVAPKLTGEQSRYILDTKEAINKMPMGEERAMEEFFLNKKIADMVPSHLGDKISNMWKAGLLTGLKTSGLNISANTAHNITEIIKDVPSVGIDIISSLFTGERSKVLTTRGLGSGFGEGTKKGWKYLMTGYDSRNVGSKLDYKPVNFGNNKAAKVFQTYTDTVFRTIGSQDQPFYYAASKHSLWSQALAAGKNKNLRGNELVSFADNLVKNPSEEMIKTAVTDAQIAVFQNKTALGEFAKRVQTAKLGNVPVGQFIVPFAQTPSAVAMQILNYSPAGAVKTIIENIGKGKFNQKAFSEGLGRSIVGTAPLAIGAALYQNGMISLDYPSGNERQIELDKAEGKTYNSIKFSEDGDWRTVTSLGPVGNLLLFGAYFDKAMSESGSLSEGLSQAALGGFSSFTEQTFLTGMTSFTNFIDDPERYSSYLPNLAASAIPTIVSDVAKATDSKQRVSRGESFVDNFKTRAQNRTPGARNELPVNIDALGNQVDRAAGPLESMIDPTRPSEDISDEITKEMRRLYDAGYTKAAPTKIGTSKGYASLTPKEEQVFYETVGSQVKVTIQKIMEQPLYKDLSDSDRETLLSKYIEKAKSKGAAVYAMQATDGMSEKERIEVLKTLKSDGIFNTDVMREYGKLLEE